MKIKVSVFGPLREFYQGREEVIGLLEDSTVSDLITHLELPSFAPFLILVNESFKSMETPLKNGDQVKILWSIGGG